MSTAKTYSKDQWALMGNLAKAVQEADTENGNHEGLIAMGIQFLLAARFSDLSMEEAIDLLQWVVEDMPEEVTQEYFPL